MKTEKPTLLFDGECKFCNFWVGLIQRQKAQNKFNYFPLNSPEGKELVKKHQVDKGLDSVIVITKEEVLYKSNAAINIAKTIGGLWKLALTLTIIPKYIRDWFYDKVANNRHRFFKNRKNCEIHN